jgi:hypothetical protein
MAITFSTQKQIQYQLVINIKEIKGLYLLQLNILNVLLLKLRFSSASHIKTGDLSIHVSVSIYTLLIKFSTQKQIQYQLVINIKEIKGLYLLQLNILNIK